MPRNFSVLRIVQCLAIFGTLYLTTHSVKAKSLKQSNFAKMTSGNSNLNKILKNLAPTKRHSSNNQQIYDGKERTLITSTLEDHSVHEQSFSSFLFEIESINKELDLNIPKSLNKAKDLLDCIIYRVRSIINESHLHKKKEIKNAKLFERAALKLSGMMNSTLGQYKKRLLHKLKNILKEIQKSPSFFNVILKTAYLCNLGKDCFKDVNHLKLSNDMKKLASTLTAYLGERMLEEHFKQKTEDVVTRDSLFKTDAILSYITSMLAKLYRAVLKNWYIMDLMLKNFARESSLSNTVTKFSHILDDKIECQAFLQGAPEFDASTIHLKRSSCNMGPNWLNDKECITPITDPRNQCLPVQNTEYFINFNDQIAFMIRHSGLWLFGITIISDPRSAIGIKEENMILGSFDTIPSKGISVGADIKHIFSINQTIYFNQYNKQSRELQNSVMLKWKGFFNKGDGVLLRLRKPREDLKVIFTMQFIGDETRGSRKNPSISGKSLFLSKESNESFQNTEKMKSSSINGVQKSKNFSSIPQDDVWIPLAQPKLTFERKSENTSIALNMTTMNPSQPKKGEKNDLDVLDEKVRSEEQSEETTTEPSDSLSFSADVTSNILGNFLGEQKNITKKEIREEDEDDLSLNANQDSNQNNAFEEYEMVVEKLMHEPKD